MKKNLVLKSVQFAINSIVVPIHSKGVHVYMCWAMIPVYSQMVALQLLGVAFHCKCMNLIPCIQSCDLSIIWLPPIFIYWDKVGFSIYLGFVFAALKKEIFWQGHLGEKVI